MDEQRTAPADSTPDGMRVGGSRRQWVLGAVVAAVAVWVLGFALPALGVVELDPSSSQPPRPRPSASWQPSTGPSTGPSTWPSGEPSTGPSTWPTWEPSAPPTWNPSTRPTWNPSTQPTWQPSGGPSPRPTGRPPKGPAALCPVQEPNGRITYPAALERLIRNGLAGAPNRAIVCRYSAPRTLGGAADVRDATTVAYIADTLRAGGEPWDNQSCEGRFELSYVFLIDGAGGRMQTVDLTDCFAWTQPQSDLLPAEFSAKLTALTS